jgi:hypothetical protein
MSRPQAGVTALAALLALAACSRPGTAPVEGPLAIDIPELCTVCVEVLRCEGPTRRVAYVMDEKDAWAQIATIWDYFAQFFRPKTEDFRPLTVYELGEDPRTALAARTGLKARLDIWHRRVELPDAVVVQKTGDWLAADGTPLGTCIGLPRGEDRQYAKALASSTLRT